MNYLLHLLILLDVYIVVAMSLNVIVGYVGLLTLAHAAYFAIGGYSYALVTLLLGWSFVPAVIAAVLVGVAFSFALSLASWRLKGDFFVLFSLAVQIAIYTVLWNWRKSGVEPGTWENLTNGIDGLNAIAKPLLFGHQFVGLGEIAILFTVIMALVGVISWTMLNSPWGRLLKAVRDDELAARSLGKDVRLIKMQAIGIAAALAGFAGALFASYMAFINPMSFDLNQSIVLLSMIIVGGVGNAFIGPFFGALLLLAIPEALRFVDLPIMVAGEVRLMVYGLLLVVLMRWRPQGIAGSYRME
ncbi:MAG: branched-chain amino acid ABC transporter permease [Alphaproteobacteria bacterium]|nr:branched-chain amino acid ABC transporter permease [Alphaproteobacteria bacterium]